MTVESKRRSDTGIPHDLETHAICQTEFASVIYKESALRTKMYFAVDPDYGEHRKNIRKKCSYGFHTESVLNYGGAFQKNVIMGNQAFLFVQQVPPYLSGGSMVRVVAVENCVECRGVDKNTHGRTAAAK